MERAIFEQFVDQRDEEVFALDWDSGHVFIDAIELYADRPFGWPDVHGGVENHVLEDGSEWTKYHFKRVGPQGRTYGLKVVHDYARVDINPASVEKPENVFGFRFQDSLKRVSDLLARHGCRGDVDWKVTRLDLTANVATGSPRNLAEYLQQVRYLEFPHCEKHLSSYGQVAWHNDAKRLTCYDKAAEVEAKHKKLVGEDEISWIRHHKESDDYIERVVDGLKRQGVCRVELKLKKPGLVSRNLRELKEITQDRLDEVFRKEVMKLKKVVLSNGGELSYAELGVLTKWMQGDFSKEEMPYSTFARYRNAIREATGYDIGSPGPVSIKRGKKKKIVTRTIGPEDIPGYYLPSVEDLA